LRLSDEGEQDRRRDADEGGSGLSQRRLRLARTRLLDVLLLPRHDPVEAHVLEPCHCDLVAMDMPLSRAPSGDRLGVCREQDAILSGPFGR
jgi:hypothetical protein